MSLLLLNDIVTTFGDMSLYPHQITAVRWMMERERDEEFCGGLLCDEMGLGKTMTTCGLLVNAHVDSTLLLGPLAVLHQWVKAVENLGMAVFQIQGMDWVLVSGNTSLGSVYITNYEKVSKRPAAFARPFDRLVADEAHFLRNSGSKKYIALKALRVTRKWLLTGTPIVNSTRDLASLMSLLNPKILPHFTPPMDKAVEWMQTYAMARTTAQLRAAPGMFPSAPIIVEHRLDFSTDAEANFYRGIQGRLEARLQTMMEHDRNNLLLFLKLILRLRQISVHPQVYIQALRREQKGYPRPTWLADSTKVTKLVDILDEERSDGCHGYVVFCHFADEMKLLKERLKSSAAVSHVGIYCGSMSQEERTAAIEAARSAIERKEGHSVLLVQMQCGGTGLNLQFMDRVIIMSPWWTAALMDQAVGRVVRIGQKKQVVVHHLMLNEEAESSLNIDDYMRARVEAKRGLCVTLLDAANHDA
jgi:SNF2 family DNA or RNA helicase